MLELNNILLKAGGHILVNEPVNARETGGQTIVFFGRNGTGKTTLLRAIAGRNGLGTYDIVINNRQQKNSSIHEWSKLVCYISSREMAGAQVNAYEYLLSARLGFTNGLGLYAEKDYRVTEKWINELGIRPLLDKQYIYLSDGEKQLVSIARAFIYETPVILLDEPTSSLDIPNKKSITEMLHRYAGTENKLIVYTSHDYFIAEKYCRQAWYLDHFGRFHTGPFETMHPVIRKDFGLF